MDAGKPCLICGGTGRTPGRDDKEYYRWHFMVDLRKCWKWLRTKFKGGKE